MNEALLINHFRLRGGRVINDQCALCGTNSETNTQALRDCVKAQELRMRVGNSFIKNFFFQQPLMTWLESNILDETQKIVNGSTACCLLWYSQNLYIFEGKDNAHLFLACRVFNLARDYDHDLSLVVIAKKNILSLAIKQVKWSPLPYHWIKINTNRSLLRDMAVASCGGITRNHHGNFVVALSINLGSCSITIAKLWGIFWGLFLGWNLGHKNVWLETNSVSAFYTTRNFQNSD